MKKIVAIILTVGMVLALCACAGEGSVKPDITLQEVYDAGKSLSALLGDHESVLVNVVSNGNVIREEYLSKGYCYSFYDAEYMDFGFDYADMVTERAEYVYFQDAYLYNVTIAPSGMIDTKENFETVINHDFISTALLDDTPVITEKDGFITVTCVSDADEIAIIGEGVISCEESYTIDANTREMTEVKTVYTYEDGTVEEGIVTVTRDVEVPEGMKPFLEYEQETVDMRTVTIVFNPGAENEKTETVQVPNGIQVSITPDWLVEEIATLYTDAACTQTFEEDFDVNSDLTVYVRWGE